MTALADNPETLNFLSGLNYKLTILRAPATNFFMQEAELPGISVGSVEQPNPFTAIRIPGEHTEFDELSATFKVDEDLRNWLEIFSWLKALGRTRDSTGYAALKKHPLWDGEGLVSDISLMFLTGEHNARVEAVFADAFPTKLSAMRLNHSAADVEYVECTATFAYTTYDVGLVS